MSSHGISATEGRAPRPGDGLPLFHLRCVPRSRLSTWDCRTGCVWRELGIWEAYWTTMEHTGSQGAGEKAPHESQTVVQIYMPCSSLCIFLGKGNSVAEKSAFNSEYNRTTAVKERTSPSPRPGKGCSHPGQTSQQRIHPRGSDCTGLQVHAGTRIWPSTQGRLVPEARASLGEPQPSSRQRICAVQCIPRWVPSVADVC